MLPPSHPRLTNVSLFRHRVDLGRRTFETVDAMGSLAHPSNHFLNLKKRHEHFMWCSYHGLKSWNKTYLTAPFLQTPKNGASNPALGRTGSTRARPSGLAAPECDGPPWDGSHGTSLVYLPIHEWLIFYRFHVVRSTNNMDVMGSCIWMNEFEILDFTLILPDFTSYFFSNLYFTKT